MPLAGNCRRRVHRRRRTAAEALSGRPCSRSVASTRGRSRQPAGRRRTPGRSTRSDSARTPCGPTTTLGRSCRAGRQPRASRRPTSSGRPRRRRASDCSSVPPRGSSARGGQRGSGCGGGGWPLGWRRRPWQSRRASRRSFAPTRRGGSARSAPPLRPCATRARWSSATARCSRTYRSNILLARHRGGAPELLSGTSLRRRTRPR